MTITAIFFKIQDGGPPPFWKSLNRHISVKNRLILMKFGTLHQILNPVTVTDQKLKFLKFKITAAAILKIVFWLLHFVWGNRMAGRQGLRDKIFKIQHGGRPPFWKSVFWPLSINRLSDFIEILYAYKCAKFQLRSSINYCEMEGR